MFEIKYDRNGEPIKGTPPVEAPVEQQSIEQVLQETQEAAPEVEQEEVQASPEPEPQPEPVQEKEQQETWQARNFREMREKALELEWENKQLKKQAQEILQKPLTKSESEDSDLSVGNDELVEGKHLTKINKKVDQRIKQLEDQLKQYQQVTQEQTIEVKLKAQYPDFDNVVSKANIEQLRNDHPELAMTLNSTTDLYSKASAAYKLIKQFGIYKEDKYVVEKALAQKNTMKPKPVASVNPQKGDSALSNANAFANGLTKELQEQLLKEMAAAQKNY